MVITVDSDGIQKYLEVFKLIFKKTGHGAHYEMMMRRSGTGSHKLNEEFAELN